MSFLSGYRVLDFTDERGLLAGRILADLGADVVHCEPPGGSRARALAPRSPDGSSLFYETYGANRRGVTVDPNTAAGRRQLEILLDAVDVVIESGGPDGDRAVGLDRAAVMGDRPSLIWCSISAFGLEGPKARYAASDLTVWAAGGPLEAHRDGDRPPVRVSAPQSYLHAAADAAAGIVMALIARRDLLGRGQHVEVSAQASLGFATLGQVLAYVTEGADPPATTPGPVGRGSRGDRRTKWDAKDGLIQFGLAIGPAAGRFTNALFAWLAEEGVDLGRFAGYDWTEVDRLMSDGVVSSADIEDARTLVSAFLSTKTKLEVTEQAVRRKVLPVGIFDVADVAMSPQLEARGYFVTLGEGARARRMPGAFAQIDQPAYVWRRPAPLVGEHTEEILREWGSTPRDRGASAPRASDRSPAVHPVLDGLRVVDVSWVVAGPSVGRSLADFGATVVRVESSTRHDAARQLPPYVGGRVDPEGSALYETCNAGKLGICLDLSVLEGRRVLRDLARWADVLIESFSPGTMDRWGLGPEELRRDNAGLVVLSSSLCGHSGPWASLAGYGSVGAALAGFQHLVGWPDRPPFGPYGPYTDYVGPRFSLVALLAALDWRRTTGTGCTIDVSQVEAGAWFLAPQIADWFSNATVAQRCGNDDADLSPNGVYRCRDDGKGRERWVAISVRDEEEWRQFVALLDASALEPEAALYGLEARRLAHLEIDAAISAWCASKEAGEVERLLQDQGIPAHVASSSEDFCTDPQLNYRGHLVRLAHPVHGEMVVEGPRWQLSLTPGGPQRHAPRFHEDTEQILLDLLGYSTAQLDALRASGTLA